MIYLILYRYFLFPCAWLFGYLLQPLNQKLHSGFSMRKKKNGSWPWLKQKLKHPVWIHCSSGEFEYARSVIREIKNRLPNQPILLTYFSPSVQKMVQKESLIDFSCPCPWDSVTHMSEFINFHQPKSLLVARTDIWPEMLYQCHLHEIPSCLFSATLTESSSRVKNPLVRAFYSFFHSFFHLIFCVSPNDQEQFSRLGLKSKCHITGDTRYDQVLYRLEHTQKLKLSVQSMKPILLCGSTWPEDEKVLLPAFEQLNKDMSFILVPHEPSKSHIANLCTQLNKANLSYQLYSETHTWDGTSVLIIDAVGVLADLYPFADFAFIGGSFKASVHSVMEALAAGCISIVGPYHKNNREAELFQKYNFSGIQFVTAVDNDLSFVAQLKHTLQKTDISGFKKEIKTQVTSLSGASEKLLAHLSAAKIL